MKRPIRQPDPKLLPPEVRQALEDYLVALLLAELELQNQPLTAQPAQGDNTAQIVRPSGHPRQGAPQETPHGEA